MIFALASQLHELRELNQRARALTLEYLTGAAAVEWLARLAHLIDAAIVRRILALTGVSRIRRDAGASPDRRAAESR